MENKSHVPSQQPDQYGIIMDYCHYSHLDSDLESYPIDTVHDTISC